MRFRPAAALAVPVLLAALAGCASGQGGYAADPPPPSYPATASGTIKPVAAPQPSGTSQQANSGVSTASTTPPAPAFDGLKPGDNGDQVRALQEKLQQEGFWVGDPDGNYGQTTSQAVMAVQKVAGLNRDGVMGPQTRQAIDRGVSVSPRSTSGKWVEIDKSRQLVALVEDGHVNAVLNTSTGTEKPYSYKGNSGIANTPTGKYTVTRQIDGMDPGPLGDLWRPKYFNGGIALHGAEDVPAYPASHGCARVSDAAMNWIWSTDQVPIGTQVWVY